MTKKSWLLVFVALACATVYVIKFTDWFKPEIIHITSINERGARTLRASRANNPGFMARLSNLASSAANLDSTTVPVIFKLGRPYKLTELKVINLDEWQTNKNCLPVWHLMASTNSAPLDHPFYYGDFAPGRVRPDYFIRGMQPVVPGERAQPLQPGVKYRLFVTDGSAKGELVFQPVAKPAPASP